MSYMLCDSSFCKMFLFSLLTTEMEKIKPVYAPKDFFEVRSQVNKDKVYPYPVRNLFKILSRFLKGSYGDSYLDS